MEQELKTLQPPRQAGTLKGLYQGSLTILTLSSQNLGSICGEISAGYTYAALVYLLKTKNLVAERRRLILDSSSEILLSIRESLGNSGQGQYRKTCFR